MGSTDGFTWSGPKDHANRAKHGVPLRFGVLQFPDGHRLEHPAKTIHGELRFMVIGKIGERVHVSTRSRGRSGTCCRCDPRAGRSVAVMQRKWTI